MTKRKTSAQSAPRAAKTKPARSAARKAPQESPVVRQAPARPTAVLQRRGVARVNAILDAAEELLAEQGYEAATLKAISDRTGIPAASVYHYFADRHQVDTALMQRHLDALSHRLDDADDLRTVADMARVVMDPMISYFREHPSFTELWFNGRSGPVAALAAEFDESVAETVWRQAVDKGILAADTPFLVAQIAYGAGGALFDAAFKDDPQGDDAVFDETKKLVTAYLTTYAPSRRRK